MFHASVLPPVSFVALLAALALPSGLVAQESTVQFREQFPPQSLIRRKLSLPDGTEVTRVRLRGHRQVVHSTRVGFPILPRVLRRVAIPLGAKILNLSVELGPPAVFENHSLVEWQGRHRPADGERRPPKPPRIPDGPDGPLFHPLDERPVLLRSIVTEAPVWPPKLISIRDRDVVAGYQVLTIEIAPVRWSIRDEELLLATSITVRLVYTGGLHPDPRDMGYADFAALEDLHDSVVNDDDITAAPYYPYPKDLDAWYLIITDNQEWNEDKTPGPALDGDIVAEFERLAEWKTQKGIKAEVVTVEDILAGRYGSFSFGTRDLQEVIRNFLKHAHTEFNTYWVLLGGDVSVIPPREVVGHAPSCKYSLERGTDPQPGENGCYWDAQEERVYIRHGSHITTDMDIVSLRTGAIFPNSTSPSQASPGWSYATDDTYSSFTTSVTDHIVLVGSTADTELMDFYVVAYATTIPTDLYYASIDSTRYDQPGKHDWDLNDNGLYGQYSATETLDGVDYRTDLAVGRAPVETVDEARTFVDKVLAYEKFDGLSVKFASRLLLGAADWHTGPEVVAGSSNPPDEGEYWCTRRSYTTICHFSSAPASIGSHDLVAYNGFGDYWYVPYNRDADASDLGYYFCTDDSFSAASEIVLDLVIFQVTIPSPTGYVKVMGPLGEIQPDSFFFDSIEPDDSVLQKEEIKEIFNTYFPELSIRKRLYQDLEDTPGYPDPDLFELTESAMESALNHGYNIVSLSGHGSYRGSAGVDSSYVATLTNGFEGGVGYADSCYTGEFNREDAVGEVFLTNPTGGLVAYVGNSRYSWVGVGDDMEKLFWEKLDANRHLGRLHNSKAMLTSGEAERWANCALNLLGVPRCPSGR